MEKFIKCACGREMIDLEIEDFDLDTIFLSLWERGVYNNSKMTWKQKLRYIWQVLRKGKPFNDCICLDRNAAIEMEYALRRMIDLMPCPEKISLSGEEAGWMLKESKNDCQSIPEGPIGGGSDEKK